MASPIPTKKAHRKPWGLVRVINQGLPLLENIVPSNWSVSAAMPKVTPSWLQDEKHCWFESKLSLVQNLRSSVLTLHKGKHVVAVEGSR